MTAETDLHTRWAARIVAALVEGGVAHVVVSPGSRSTPLVLALADEPRLDAHVVLDERSAAFVALGIARASGRPAAVVATSGTAPAHWFPAVIEASESAVPLVLVSADRPWEAQHAASPQTVDQAHLFGRHARRYVDVGAPEASEDALRALPRALAEALARAAGPEPGPVHVNARFRKPLEPRGLASDPVVDAARPLLATPAPRVVASTARLDDADAADVASLWSTTARGVIAAGPMPLDGARAADAVAELASRTGFAVYAEATSQLRRALGDAVTVPQLDLLLRAGAVPDELLPEVIIEVGAPPVASSWSTLLDRARATRIVVAARGVPDPRGDARVVVRGDVPSSLRALAAATRWRGPSGFTEAWRALSRRATSAAAAARPSGEALAAQLAARSASDRALLLVGNSSPVRDVDAWAPFPTPGAGVLHQRGASGIDGMVAQAIGATIGAARPVVALLGDLTFFHDASSLASLRLARAPLTIVVVDNGGGRIFDDLPIARAGRPRELERFFTTRQDVAPEALAAAYGARFVRARDDDELAHALDRDAGTAPRVVWVDAAPGSAAASRARARAALSGAEGRA